MYMYKEGGGKGERDEEGKGWWYREGRKTAGRKRGEMEEREGEEMEG